MKEKGHHYTDKYLLTRQGRRDRKVDFYFVYSVSFAPLRELFNNTLQIFTLQVTFSAYSV
jgi:hypothetical protein